MRKKKMKMKMERRSEKRAMVEVDFFRLYTVRKIYAFGRWASTVCLPRQQNKGGHGTHFLFLVFSFNVTNIVEIMRYYYFLITKLLFSCKKKIIKLIIV